MRGQQWLVVDWWGHCRTGRVCDFRLSVTPRCGPVWSRSSTCFWRGDRWRFPPDCPDLCWRGCCSSRPACLLCWWTAVWCQTSRSSSPHSHTPQRSPPYPEKNIREWTWLYQILINTTALYMWSHYFSFSQAEGQRSTHRYVQHRHGSVFVHPVAVQRDAVDLAALSE